MFSRVSQLRFVGVWVPRSSGPFCSFDFYVLYLFLFFSSNCARTCAYGVCWSRRNGMATGRIMRWVLLGTKVGLIEIESSGWKWWSCSLLQLGDQSLTFSFWCQLYLFLWSLLELWRRTGHRDDNMVGGVRWQSVSWESRIQWVE